MMNKNEDFINIHKVNELIEFLDQNGFRHRNYYHYTDLESAIKIIESGHFHLTRGNAMCINDYQECRKGSQEMWNRTYIGSFVYGDNENMAMWGLYGLPWKEAVRITIPRSAMMNWISNKPDIFNIEYNNDIKYNPIHISKSINLTDIVYISGKRGSQDVKIFWNDKSLDALKVESLVQLDQEPSMTGYIKNSAWKYENEVRIRICLEEAQSYEKIAINIPDNIINEMTITAGPYFEGDIINAINQKLHERNINKQIKKTDISSFTKLVNYRDLCRMCINDFRRA